jgi:hypothetical protein
MAQLSTTERSCIAILCVSLVNFFIVTLCVASQLVFIVVSVYFVIDSVRKLLDTPSYDHLYNIDAAVCNKIDGRASFRPAA